jgi:hypothetical protein
MRCAYEVLIEENLNVRDQFDTVSRKWEASITIGAKETEWAWTAFNSLRTEASDGHFHVPYVAGYFLAN